MVPVKICLCSRRIFKQGETPEHAVKREYLEETGVLINPKDIIAVRFNLKDWYVAFSADYVSGQEHSDNDENSEVVWLDVDVALKRNDVPQLRNSVQTM
ncbi:NUDIX hydrolase [human gut metagenome]|uniref:NUDIX hydrolase n=1 Tax=human gut metagenome TaxID=408170 RepID=K1TQT8_9ZZZZ